MLDVKKSITRLLVIVSYLWVACLLQAWCEFVADLEQELKISFSLEELWWIASNFKWFFLSIVIGLSGLVFISYPALK
jgi:hypothetical protein